MDTSNVLPFKASDGNSISSWRILVYFETFHNLLFDNLLLSYFYRSSHAKSDAKLPNAGSPAYDEDGPAPAAPPIDQISNSMTLMLTMIRDASQNNLNDVLFLN